MASYESHTDSDPLITGTHKGADEADTLYDPGALFMTVGVIEGLAIYKTVASSDLYLTNGNGIRVTDADGNGITLSTGTNIDQNSTVDSATDDQVYSTGISWLAGDTYAIYKTGTKDSYISRIGIDRSRGWKVTNKAELNSYGWLPEDADIDKDSNGNSLPKHKRPFSPGSPADKR